jgi:sec-independent protein translocase protein TatA
MLTTHSSTTAAYAGLRSTLTIMFGLQAPELLVILAIILVIFGGTQLPKLARSLGRAQKEFKDGLSGTPDDDDPDDTAEKKPERKTEKKAEKKNEAS